MSTVTMGALLAANPVPFHRAAVAWAAMAEDIDNAYELFIRGVRGVDTGWASGSAAAAAIRRLTAQGHELSNAHNPARRIADALERHAYAVGDLRLRAEEAILDGERNGLRINRNTGQISARVGFQPAAEAMIARAVPGLTRELADLLERAQRLDDETTATIRANQPAPGYGFGAQLAWHVDRDAVARQRGRPAKAVQAWWQDLSPEQQEQVIQDYPELIGWLDGVPATDRDRANRANLDRQLGDRQAEEARLAYLLTHPSADDFYATAHGDPLAAARHEYALQRRLEQVRSEEAGLRAVRDTLGEFGDRALLIGVDGHGDGRTAIALGDPDHARHTAVFVPGVNTDLRDVAGDMDRARHLREAADRMTPQTNDVAVVYWLGYDTPSTWDALSYGASREGAKAFTPFVDALRATHDVDNDPYHVSAVGHSYGSTVIAESALSGGLAVDDIITAGSPGMHTDRAANLHIDPHHVWGGLADGDPIGGALGDLSFVHGEEPTDPVFGDNRYEVDTRGHSAYWTDNSESLRNQAYIVVGQYDKVRYDYGYPPQS